MTSPEVRAAAREIFDELGGVSPCIDGVPDEEVLDYLREGYCLSYRFGAPVVFTLNGLHRIIFDANFSCITFVPVVRFNSGPPKLLPEGWTNIPAEEDAAMGGGD